MLGTVSGTAGYTPFISNSTPTLRNREGRKTDDKEEKLSVWLCHTDSQGKGWWQKLLPFRFCLVLFFSFETGSHCAASAGSELSMKTRQADSSSQRLDCFCLLSAEAKGEPAHAYLLCGSLIMILFIGEATSCDEGNRCKVTGMREKERGFKTSQTTVQVPAPPLPLTGSTLRQVFTHSL